MRGQPLSRQPVRQRRLTPVRPRLQQRDRPVDTTPADENHAVITALGEQDLQPLPASGWNGWVTTTKPKRSLGWHYAAFVGTPSKRSPPPAWGSPPGGPATAGTCPRPGPDGPTPSAPAATAPADRTVEYLRCLLVHYDVLPPRDRRLADFQRWAAAKLDGISNAEHRRLLERFLQWRLLRHLRSCSGTAVPLGHGPHQRAKQRLTVTIAILAWLADRGRQVGECTQHDLDQWFATGPTTRRHVITFLSWARQQRIIRDVAIPVINTDGAEACPPGTDARLAAIRRLLLDETLAPGDRLAGCVVTLYGQQPSRIATLRTTDTFCADGAMPRSRRNGTAQRSRARVLPGRSGRATCSPG